MSIGKLNTEQIIGGLMHVGAGRRAAQWRERRAWTLKNWAYCAMLKSLIVRMG